MAIPEADLTRIRDWCEEQTSPEHRDQLRYEAEVDGHRVTVVEVSPPWDGEGAEVRFPVARFTWVARREVWELYWRDRNSKFHLYDQARPSHTIVPLLAHVERDPYAIFFG
ncbi:DUF3024 domain-containing protein [Demequina sp. SYSU T00192]|uniref:DUF3024 domain-containing protein n=1 Tax=Demequina litoralis TaxID=3051660 RepID=A0ABT8G9K1_9MICO|nr:DUF3024 domain-containing protein [Demequina sp. SYSU T00192]MDN4475814.1 DUF3024 domain-containing protein [Demequina sp. SYSU T00192]